MKMNLTPVSVAFLFLTSCTVVSHDGLEGREVGINFQYLQNTNPNDSQKKEGENALRCWKKASAYEQYFLADKIVKSRCLIGMTKKEVDASLGELEFLTVRVPYENGPMSVYNLIPPPFSHESSASLIAQYDEDRKVKVCFVEVNR